MKAKASSHHSRTRQKSLRRSTREPAVPRRIARTRAALLAATSSDAWVRAAFRLMLASVPGAFASAALRCTEADIAYWVTSRGERIHSAEMPEMIAGHPGLPYLMAHPGLKVLPTRGVLPPPGELEKLSFYQRFMVPYGWRHAVGLCFWKHNGEPGVECVLSVHRSAEAGDFSDAETERLGALHAEIERALWRVAALEEERGARSSFEHFAESLPLPLALLNWQGRPLYHNRLARRACARWLEGPAACQRKTDRNDFVPPPELIAACRELQAEWRERVRTNCVGKSVLERVVHPASDRNDRALTATVRLLHLNGATLGEPTFTVQFFEQPRNGAANPGAPAPNLAALHRLTPVERTAVLLAGAAFKSNAEIAAELGRSIGTIKAELHSAYKKLGVRTRAELVSLLRG